jgi:putative DNA primase/helicase
MNYMEPDIEYENFDYSESHENSTSQEEKVTALGFDQQLFYYYSTSTRQITSLSPAQHTKAHLCGLASAVRYWENFQQFQSKNGFSWGGLADMLMTQCRDVGIFNPSRSRGRGAWIEGDVPLLHVGDALIVDGKRAPLVYPGSKHIYEAAAPLINAIAPALPTADAHWLIKVCKMLRWDKPASGTLLAGWLAVAPICGALRWRPSVWLTGSSGSGKSWIMDHVVTAVLGEIALAVASVTSEAGIRHKLQRDALPVVFDEAESEGQADQARMQAVFNLVRVSSSENSPNILKGQQNQSRAKDFRIRSAFLFQSINVGLAKKADENRVSVLSLRDYSNGNDVPFIDLELTVRERLTPEFSAGLISRSVSLIPVIRANAEIFARAISDGLGSRRLGDQLGTLLAGAYSLHSSGLVTPAQAAVYVAREDWNEQSSAEDDKDEFRLLRQILATKIRLGSTEMPVSRLVEAARATEQLEGMPHADTAARAISEHGVKLGYRDNLAGVYFSTNHPALKQILNGTDWAASWSRSLARLPAAVSGRDVLTRFALGHVSKAVWVPMATIDPN